MVLTAKHEFSLIWRDAPQVAPQPESFNFRCPECFTHFQPANVQCITCPNCGNSGNKQGFSAIVRKAA